MYDCSPDGVYSAPQCGDPRFRAARLPRFPFAYHCISLLLLQSDSSDFVYVTEKAYNLLKQWYGVAEGSPQFPRRVIEVRGSARIEGFPQPITVRTIGLQSTCNMLLSRYTLPTAALEAMLVQCKDWVPPGCTKNNTRLWVQTAQQQQQQPQQPSSQDADTLDANADASTAATDPSSSPSQPTQSPSSSSSSAGDSDGASLETAEGWTLWTAPTTLDDLARNDTATTLLAERRNANGTWPRGDACKETVAAAQARALLNGAESLELAAPEAAVAWRASLVQGSVLDVQDREKTWYQAEVTAITAGVTPEEDELTCRFRGWTSKYAEVHKRGSVTLQPVLSHTLKDSWRPYLRPGDQLDVCVDPKMMGLNVITTPENPVQLADGGSWYVAWVASMDFTVFPPAVATAFVWDVYAKIARPLARFDVEDFRVTSYKRHTTRDQEPPPVSKPSKVPPKQGDAYKPGVANAKSSTVTRSGTGAVAGAGATGSMLTRLGIGVGNKRTAYGSNSEAEEDDPAGNGDAAHLEDQALVAQRFADFYNAPRNTYNYYSRNRVGGASLPGVCGLDNLGNTCFMNSMLQCLSNTELLCNYFRTGEYVKDVNLTNHMGSKGRLAHAFAALMKAMWGTGHGGAVAPSPVKELVARKAPQFIGWQQHDSQEFMSFLLDGLLEDTCRVADKRQSEPISSDGKTDEEVAALFWQAYIARNDSRVAEIFGGQFRSHVHCNVCTKSSVSCDPFLAVSVPIPVTKWQKQTFYFFDDANHTPVHMGLFYRDRLTAGDLAQWLCTFIQYGGFIPNHVGAVPYFDAPPVLARGDVHKDSLWLKTSPGARPAGPHEFLVVLTASDPCSDFRVVPHFADMQLAINNLLHSKSTFDAPHSVCVMVWHCPGAGQPRPQPSLGAAAASAASTAAAPYAYTGEGVRFTKPKKVSYYYAMDSDDEGEAAADKGGAPAPTPEQLAAGGPRCDEVAAVWLRNVNALPTGGVTISSLGDSIHVSLRAYNTPAVSPVDAPALALLPGAGTDTATAAVSADAMVDTASAAAATMSPAPAGLTNKQVHEEVWRKMRRLIKPGVYAGLSADRAPYVLGTVRYDPSTTRIKQAYTTLVATPLPYDDAPFVPCVAPAEDGCVVQLALDYRATEWQLQCNGREAANSLPHTSSEQYAAAPQSRVNLNDCFAKFSDKEQLSAADSWYCPQCKEHRQAFKKMDLWRLPEVLVVHLKRFEYGVGGFYGGGLRGKINELVDFPTRGLDLSGYTVGPQAAPPVYDLFAVSVSAAAPYCLPRPLCLAYCSTSGSQTTLVLLAAVFPFAGTRGRPQRWPLHSERHELLEQAVVQLQ